MSVNKKNTGTLWDLNKASILMVVLPYIGFNWRELYESPYYSIQQAGLVLLVLITIELAFTHLVKKMGKYEKLLSVLFICFTILFFYGNNIVIPIYQYITKSLQIYIKEKVLFIIISFFLLLILHYLLAKKNLWKVFNVFLGIYFIVNIFSTRNLNIAVIPPIDSIQNGYKHINESLSSDKNGNENNNEGQKPIILIVLDEYSSPDELYKIVKDSSVYNFSNTLEKKGWEVRNSSYTYESSTIHSISSLFNFNLSKLLHELRRRRRQRRFPVRVRVGRRCVAEIACPSRSGARRRAPPSGRLYDDAPHRAPRHGTHVATQPASAQLPPHAARAGDPESARPRLHHQGIGRPIRNQLLFCRSTHSKRV
jgi:hypothetical protein